MNDFGGSWRRASGFGGSQVSVINLGGSGFTPSSAESAAFLARATSITSTTDKTNYDTLITGLVGDGVFAKLDALYIFATVGRTTAVLNLIQNAYNLTETGTVSFSAYNGYTGDASTFYLDSGFNPSTASSPQYTLNSASMGFYCLNNRQSGGNKYTIGVDQIASAYINPYQFGAPLTTIHDGTVTTGSAGTSGFWEITRTAASGAGAVTLYNWSTANGNSGSIGTSTSSSMQLPTNTIYVFALDQAGSAVVLTDDQLSAAFIGGGHTGTDVSNLKGRLNTFMTAYGINRF